MEEVASFPLPLLAQGSHYHWSHTSQGIPVCLISFLTLQKLWPTLIHDLINQIQIWSGAYGAHRENQRISSSKVTHTLKPCSLLHYRILEMDQSWMLSRPLTITWNQLTIQPSGIFTSYSFDPSVWWFSLLLLYPSFTLLFFKICISLWPWHWSQPFLSQKELTGISGSMQLQEKAQCAFYIYWAPKTFNKILTLCFELWSSSALLKQNVTRLTFEILHMFEQHYTKCCFLYRILACQLKTKPPSV